MSYVSFIRDLISIIGLVLAFWSLSRTKSLKKGLATIKKNYSKQQHFSELYKELTSFITYTKTLNEDNFSHESYLDNLTSMITNLELIRQHFDDKIKYDIHELINHCNKFNGVKLNTSLLSNLRKKANFTYNDANEIKRNLKNITKKVRFQENENKVERIFKNVH